MAGKPLRRYPEAVELLAELGLDTCCGGAEALEEAAKAAGRNPGNTSWSTGSCWNFWESSEAPSGRAGR